MESIQAAQGLESYHILGVKVSVVTPETAVGTLIAWAQDDHGRLVCVRDAHGIMQAQRDQEFKQIHCQADMVTPDGMPLALIGKLRGLSVERTCGPDLMLDVIAASNAAGLKHYFYGGREGIADQLAARMRSFAPGVDIVGIQCPLFRDLSDSEVAALAKEFNALDADIIWIGLSTPKQERLMARLRPLVTGTLIGVGAAFDVHSGHLTRAPQWMQTLCLEGVYRLIREPRRLWHRYLVLAPQFAWLASVEQISGDWKKTQR